MTNSFDENSRDFYADLEDNILVVKGKLRINPHVRRINQCLYRAYKANIGEVLFDFTNLDFEYSNLYPEHLVALAAMLDSYRSEGGMEIEPVFPSGDENHPHATQLGQCFNPVSTSKASEYSVDQVLNNVWKLEGDQSEIFYGHDEGGLWDKIQTALYSQVEFKSGWFYVLEWIVGEIIDNIQRHSFKNYGFFCVQRSVNKAVMMAIADNGTGIKNSFRYSSQYGFIRDDVTAITKAIEKGVTRDKSIGKGWGLYGTTQMARLTENSWVRVDSGRGAVTVTNGETFKNDYYNPFVLRGEGGSLVSVVLPVASVSIDPSEVTGTLNDSLFWEQFFNDDPFSQTEVASINAREFPGYGSRYAGEIAFTRVVNVLNVFDSVEIDFEGIPVIVASFADELFGKLLLKLGSIEEFKKRVSVRHPEDFVKAQISASLTGRVDDLTT